MKIFIIVSLILLAQLCPAKTANADVFIVYKTDTKEVASIQDDDSAVLQQGYTKKVISGKSTSDYPLEYNPLYYKFENNKLVVNVKKLSDEENSKTVEKEIIAEQKLVDQKIKDIAIDALREDGVNLKHIKKSDE